MIDVAPIWTTPRALKSRPASALTGTALWAAAHGRVAMWNRSAQSPQQAQLETLLTHCRVGADTEFGRAHGLARVRTAEDFAQRVPLRTYADFEPYLVRMRHGARNVLHPEFIKYFGCSSGTSHTAAGNKYLPISTTQIRWQQKAGFDVLARYLTLTGDREFTKGFVLALMPPSVLEPEGEIFVTSNPGLMQRFMPRTGRFNTLPKPPIRDIKNYDHKLTAMAEAYVDYDIRALSGTTCWFSVLFDRVLDAARRRGRRADTVADVWPNLSALFGGGVNAEPYRPVINSRAGRHVVLIDNYNATEGGILACSDRIDEDGLLVIPDRGVFFEFVAREDHGKPDAKRVPLWRVETGQEYSMVLTTASGLYGYVIGDFVKFTSVFPHRMVFSGRASGVLSVTQELTTNLELERAVREASQKFACTTVDFGAAADVGVDSTALGRYLFFIEFERDPEDLEAYARAVDAGLCSQNRVYREHRANEVAILMPKVIPLARGATRKFMQALGQQSVQQKFPRVLDDRGMQLLRSFAREPGANGVKGQPS